MTLTETYPQFLNDLVYKSQLRTSTIRTYRYELASAARDSRFQIPLQALKLDLAELWRGHVGTDELVEQTRAFFINHEPLCLCDHGWGKAHDAHCDSLLADREKVGHIRALAQRCLAAMRVVDSLRNGEPIYQAEDTTLDLEEASLLPLEWNGFEVFERMAARVRIWAPMCVAASDRLVALLVP